MTKTEALTQLAQALKESAKHYELKFLVSEFTLAIAQHREGKLSTDQLIAKLRNLAHIETLSKGEQP